MSRVYFHSPSGEAELSGSERAWASNIIEDMACGIVTPSLGSDRDRMLELIPLDHYLHQINRDTAGWKQAFQTAWRAGLDLQWEGHRLSAWDFTLNTALVLGNDQVRFLARLHGQCEIHGWVEGPNRAWLAELIEDGRSAGLCRADMGWENVISLLRTRDDEPVVMSYSVCDSFPNRHAAEWERPADDEDGETFYDLPEDEQWERGMRWLRSQPGLTPLRPATWTSFRFMHRLSVFDLIAPDRDDRLSQRLSEYAGGPP